MKKLINQPEAVVEEMVEGLLIAYPGLRRLPGRTVLVREMADRDRIALISGGGSGHEPAHAGYVGTGMLSAAVAGDVFTSPSPSAVLAAIRATAGAPGALLIVKNYTGDRLNFGLAAEFARSEGIPVEIVVVADDVALAGETRNAGRRGLAGTIFVHKIAGAAIADGLGLDEVTAEAREAAEAVRTMGVALSPCWIPGAEQPNFTLGPGEIELGLGIHGEPGVRRLPLTSADEIVDQLLDPILADLEPAGGERIALMVNNLGATPTMELAILARRAVATLERRGLQVERVFTGTFVSALEMAGVSLSVLRLDDRRLARLDAPTSAPAWPAHPGRPATRVGRVQERLEADPVEASRTFDSVTTPLGRLLRRILSEVTDALIAAEPELTELDRRAGDGDLGLTLTRGARALRLALPSYPLDDPPATLHALAMTLMDSLGGTSGPLYSGFFLAMADRLRSANSADPLPWLEAFREGSRAITRLGGAEPGDRTMLDALLPAWDGAEEARSRGGSASEIARHAADQARRGAEATASLSPRLGRSSYLRERVMGIPDPGARAVAVWLDAVARAISDSAA